MTLRMLPLALLMLAACGSTDADGAQSAASQSVSSKLTAGYLEGSWCYTHHVAGGERSDDKINYVFSANGSLLYQVNPTTAINKPGTYTIENGHLRIIPTLRFFDFTVEAIEPDAMVLKMPMGKAYWQRGACSE